MTQHTPGPWSTDLVCRDVRTKEGQLLARIHGHRMNHRAANARLIAAAPDLLQHLRALTHLANVLNNRQHAGLRITPIMWSELYQRTQEAQSLITTIDEEV